MKTRKDKAGRLLIPAFLAGIDASQLVKPMTEDQAQAVIHRLIEMPDTVFIGLAAKAHLPVQYQDVRVQHVSLEELIEMELV